MASPQKDLPNPIEPGKWKLGKLIGSGSYGTVFQGLRLDTGALIAIKTLILPPSASEDDDLSEIKQIHGEIELMSSLVHENIVTYLGADQGRKRVRHWPTSKAPISVVFHSFWLIFRRVIISRNGLDRDRLSLERARAERPR